MGSYRPRKYIDIYIYIFLEQRSEVFKIFFVFILDRTVENGRN